MKTEKTKKTEPRLISAKAAAQYLGIPYTSLRERVFAGEIPVVKVGRSWYFERVDLDRFVESHKETFNV
ncbi:MAG TPA: helix-turn-helix domain-containing protein [Thermoanaerobaculia bacterium]|nr:helix-turn-helix domain-containing protein [Thermoanaerobaculia bacterium]